MPMSTVPEGSSANAAAPFSLHLDEAHPHKNVSHPNRTAPQIQLHLTYIAAELAW